jgi:hypothetical protein
MSNLAGQVRRGVGEVVGMVERMVVVEVVLMVEGVGVGVGQVGEVLTPSWLRGVAGVGRGRLVHGQIPTNWLLS